MTIVSLDLLVCSVGSVCVCVCLRLVCMWASAVEFVGFIATRRSQRSIARGFREGGKERNRDREIDIESEEQKSFDMQMCARF